MALLAEKPLGAPGSVIQNWKYIDTSEGTPPGQGAERARNRHRPRPHFADVSLLKHWCITPCRVNLYPRGRGRGRDQGPQVQAVAVAVAT